MAPSFKQSLLKEAEGDCQQQPGLTLPWNVSDAFACSLVVFLKAFPLILLCHPCPGFPLLDSKPHKHPYVWAKPQTSFPPRIIPHHMPQPVFMAVEMALEKGTSKEVEPSLCMRLPFLTTLGTERPI